MKKLYKSIQLWLTYKITYCEISYGQGAMFYRHYSKNERKAIAYNIAREYLNF